MFDRVVVVIIEHPATVFQAFKKAASNLPFQSSAGPQVRDVRDKLGVVSDCRVADFEATVSGTKGNRDSTLLPVLIDYLFAPHDCVEGRQTLLAIDDERRRSQSRSIGTERTGFTFTGGVPQDERAYGEAEEQRVKQIPDFRILPNEGALQVWESELLPVNFVDQHSDRPFAAREHRGPPANFGLPRLAVFLFRVGIVSLVILDTRLLGLWLRKFAANGAGDIGDGLRQVVLQANDAAEPRHCGVDEGVDPVLEQFEGLRRVLDRESQDDAPRNLLEILVVVALGAERRTRVISDRSDDADPHLGPGESAGQLTSRHETQPACALQHVPAAGPFLIGILDRERQ